MAKGMPDWNINTDALPFYEADFSELAAKLGSPDTLSRSGRTIQIIQPYEDFPRFNYSAIGTDYKLMLSTKNKLFGKPTLLVQPPTDGNKYLATYVNSVLVSTHNIGCAFYFLMGGTLDNFQFYTYIYDGDYLYRSYIQYVQSTNILRLFDGSDISHDIKTITNGFDLTNEVPQYLKVTFDIQSLNYLWLQLNDEIFNISQFTIKKSVFNFNPRMEFNLATVNSIAGSGLIFLSSIIFSIDEPTL